MQNCVNSYQGPLYRIMSTAGHICSTFSDPASKARTATRHRNRVLGQKLREMAVAGQPILLHANPSCRSGPLRQSLACSCSNLHQQLVGYRGQGGQRPKDSCIFSKKGRRLGWASPPCTILARAMQPSNVGVPLPVPQALVEVTSSRPSLSHTVHGHEPRPCRRHHRQRRPTPPSTDRPQFTSTLPNFSRPYCSIQTHKDTHCTSHNTHARCTIPAPPWFEDRATTFRPTHSRGNPSLSPFLLPNLSRLCITAQSLVARQLPARQATTRAQWPLQPATRPLLLHHLFPTSRTLPRPRRPPHLSLSCPSRRRFLLPRPRQRRWRPTWTSPRDILPPALPPPSQEAPRLSSCQTAKRFRSAPMAPLLHPKGAGSQRLSHGPPST